MPGFAEKQPPVWNPYVVVFMGIMWAAGIAVAKGYISNFFAIVFPPYAFYLTVEFAIRTATLAQ